MCIRDSGWAGKRSVPGPHWSTASQLVLSGRPSKLTVCIFLWNIPDGILYQDAAAGGLSKTVPAAVLDGSMFSKPCAPAQKCVLCTRAAAPAAALGLLYHDAAKRPQQNRTCCGFVWFNVLKALCAGTGACAIHTCSRASGGFGVIIP